MSENPLKLQDKNILVSGLANRRSVAYHVGQFLRQEGANVIYSVHSEQRRESVASLVGSATVLVCDVSSEQEIQQLPLQVQQNGQQLDGLVHSIAFADYSAGIRPFHETDRASFLEAVDISCFSLVALSNALKGCFSPDASVVTISISTTRMAAENYGFMAPIKAALDSSLAFLAKSFSRFSQVRFNAVSAGLLKTSSSAGIPGYVDSYLYAEQAIPRKEGLKTSEVANVVGFLVSPISSGINSQSIVVDAGMSTNYFDEEIIRRVLASDHGEMGNSSHTD